MDPTSALAGHVFTTIPIWEVTMRLVMAAAFASVIGLDREAKDRPAGLRTHMLTALAAAVFTLLTLEMAYDFARNKDLGSVDPSRVIQAVTAGVAFLAAGSIIQSGNKVHGLTTGAGMWMAGALGVACGSGYYLVAAIATVAAVVILKIVHRLEDNLRAAAKQATETTNDNE